MKTSKWTSAKKQRVYDAIDYWLEALALKPFVISYVFEAARDPENEDTLMSIRCNHPYRSAKLTVFPGMVDITDERVNQCCAHEVTHIILDSLDHHRMYAGTVWCDEVEKVVEQLSMCMDELARKLGASQDRVRELERRSFKRRG